VRAQRETRHEYLGVAALPAVGVTSSGVAPATPRVAATARISPGHL